ncbi:PD-(D/E)XK nuclease family protein [Haladaptatus cibarius]|uniref:PD-(D/E)XK nuclease family protein n=1 Tax=Haladaptatus cibarius TaxID=453847 RepID=UPI000679C5EF|nr:PD-(D/E)XK nuclease family protein [Haladaptatus cibarius]
MSLKKAKSVERLYDDCRGYDRVVVPDAPLAQALNRRLDEPRLGSFAVTPRGLAAGREWQPDDRRLFLAVIDRTELHWKRASYLVRAVLNCWSKTGSLDSIFEYERFDTDAMATVVAIAQEADTRHRRLAEYESEDESVAVIALELFSELERSVLPSEYDEISAFADTSFDHEPFRVFDSEGAIVETLFDSITAENANEVAVVMDGGSSFPALVESALESAEIPFHGGPQFADESANRAFLSLLRAGFAGSDLRVRDVRPVLTALGENPAVEHDEKRLSALSASSVEWLQSFRDGIEDETFASALKRFESRAGVSLPEFRRELGTLGIAGKQVTETAVDDLEFYLQSFDVPVDRDENGVLLASAKSAAYVDRPVVFYLGMDEGWTHSPPVWPWTDSERQFDRNLRQFQLLLQNGVERYSLVLDESGGRPVTPCLYFEELLDADFDRFSDLESVAHSRPYRTHKVGFEHEPISVSDEIAESTDAISQSSLNSFVACPRDYFFRTALESPDKIYFREGNLFHDFAEFYVNHSPAVDDDLISEVVAIMLDEVSPFFPDAKRPVRETRYRIGIETIIEYLDADPPESGEFLTPESGWGENTFAEKFDRSVESPLTERWFENDSLGLKGKIDLVHSPTRLLDYKSGSKKSAYSVVKSSSSDDIVDRPNFQALLYLAHWRNQHPGRQHRFTFFHFLETLSDVVTGEADIGDTLTTVTYYPESFPEFVASREVYDRLCDGYKDCRTTFEDLGFEQYREIASRRPFPETTDKADLRESEYAANFTADVSSAVTTDADPGKGCDQALRELNGVRKRNYFREDVDAFESFVAERLGELNDYRTGERFPVGEPAFDHLDNRDCILTDD